MNNLLTQGTSRVGLSLALNFGTANQFVALRPVNYTYYVEECQISDDVINVEFILNDTWCAAIVSRLALRSFIAASGLNDYCFDNSVNGEHVQDSGSLDIHTFIDENLSAAITAYLTFKRIGQNVN